MVTEPYTWRAILWVLITLIVMWVGSNSLDVLFKKRFRMLLANIKQRIANLKKNKKENL